MSEENITTDFYVGQIFEETYPPEAAQFCNDSRKYYIDEITKPEDTVRKFEIKAIPDPTLDELKARKLNELKNKFSSKMKSNYLISSINGAVINADRDAEQNIKDLLTLYNSKQYQAISFCLYDNTFMEIDYSTLSTFYNEVIQSLYNLRQEKFEYRDKIDSAQSKEELDNIVIEFTVSNFLQ